MTDERTQADRTAVEAALERAKQRRDSAINAVGSAGKSLIFAGFMTAFDDRAILAAEVARWRAEWQRIETVLNEIQETADGGGMAGHGGDEDLRRFRQISDLVNRVWEQQP